MSPSITPGCRWSAHRCAGLHHLVGLEDIRADLVAPGDVALFAVLTLDLGALLVRLDLVELGLEHLHRHLAVTALAAFRLAGDHDACGRWVMRTAVSTLFTFCPPLPPER